MSDFQFPERGISDSTTVILYEETVQIDSPQ